MNWWVFFSVFIRSLSVKMNIAGMIILVLMMLLTVCDVFLRFFFKSPILGSTEITEYMMVSLALCVPYCTLMKKTIKMELFINRLSKRSRAVSDAFTDCIGFFTILFLSFQLFKEVRFAYNIGLSSSILGIPSFPFYGILAFSISIMGITLLVNIVENIAKVWKNEP